MELYHKHNYTAGIKLYVSKYKYPKSAKFWSYTQIFSEYRTWIW